MCYVLETYYGCGHFNRYTLHRACKTECYGNEQLRKQGNLNIIGTTNLQDHHMCDDCSRERVREHYEQYLIARWELEAQFRQDLETLESTSTERLDVEIFGDPELPQPESNTENQQSGQSEDGPDEAKVDGSEAVVFSPTLSGHGKRERGSRGTISLNNLASNIDEGVNLESKITTGDPEQSNTSGLNPERDDSVFSEGMIRGLRLQEPLKGRTISEPMADLHIEEESDSPASHDSLDFLFEDTSDSPGSSEEMSDYSDSEDTSDPEDSSESSVSDENHRALQRDIDDYFDAQMSD